MRYLNRSFNTGDWVMLKEEHWLRFQNQPSLYKPATPGPWEIITQKERSNARGWKKDLLVTDGNRVFTVFSGSIRKATSQERKKMLLEQMFVNQQ